MRACVSLAQRRRRSEMLRPKIDVLLIKGSFFVVRIQKQHLRGSFYGGNGFGQAFKERGDLL